MSPQVCEECVACPSPLHFNDVKWNVPEEVLKCSADSNSMTLQGSAS
jgi:hypothetical protein